MDIADINHMPAGPIHMLAEATMDIVHINHVLAEAV